MGIGDWFRLGGKRKAERLRSKRRPRRTRLLRSIEPLELRLVLDCLGPAAYDAISPHWFDTVRVSGAESSTLGTGSLGAASSLGDSSGPIDPQALVSRWIVRLTSEAAAQVSSVSNVEPILRAGGLPYEVQYGLGLPGQVLVDIPNRTYQTVVDDLSQNPAVAQFEPDVAIIGPQSTTPSDTLFRNQSGLQNTGQTGGTSGADIKAAVAWDVTQGSRRTVVGVIDSGLDYTHEDLYENVWINQGEVPGAIKALNPDTDGDGLITFQDLNDPRNAGLVADANGNQRRDGYDLIHDHRWADSVDTDGNGYTDDLIGWNFQAKNNDPYDDYRHGTHVAGIIGAAGNNSQGVAGVNWDVSLMPLKFLDQYNRGLTSDAILAINYATMMHTSYGVNIRVTNNSWGRSGDFSPNLRDAIRANGDADMLFVTAAGNGNVLGRGVDNDVVAFYPASYDLPNILSVAATDYNDQLATFSNYGRLSVDLAAPGVGILSTEPHDAANPQGNYAWRNGTSMAAPFVTGVAALLWSRLPDATADEVRQAILSGVDPLSSLKNRVATGGRLNAAGALATDTYRPRVSLQSAADITDAGGSVQELYLTIHDNAAVKLTSLDGYDLVVTPLDHPGDPINAYCIRTDKTQDAADVVATYRIDAPGGRWDPADNGVYQVSLRADEIKDIHGNAALSKVLGQFQVNVPNIGQILVDSTADAPDANPADGRSDDGSGHSTLRAAIMQANATTGDNAILVPAGTYTLTVPSAGADSTASGDLDVTDATGTLTIIGAKQGGTIIDAQGLDRIFQVFPGVRLDLQNVTLRGGQAASGEQGGGILNAGILNLTDTRITGSHANRGGGIFSTGALTILRSTLDHNVADDSGGGLFTAAASVVSITNSTFSDNVAQVAGGGVCSSGPLQLLNATIAGNSTQGHGGGLANTGTTSVRNTILAANTAAGADPDVQGALVTGGNNLVGDAGTSTGFTDGVNGDLIGTSSHRKDPVLGPLADNGGLTPTRELLVGSLAINAGTFTGAPATDQRGAARPKSGQGLIDIGAFERNYVEIHGVKFHDANGSGVRDPGEPGLAGWTMYLDLNHNGILDANEPRTVTAADNLSTPNVDETGQYAFTHLEPGTYSVREVPQDNFTQTFPRELVFTPGSSVSVGGNPAAMGAEDFNRDGFVDLVVADRSDNSVSVLLNQRGGVLQATAAVPVGTAPAVLATGLLNEDSYPDLVVGNQGSNDLTLLVNNGEGNFAAAQTVAVGGQPVALAASDLNGDGRTDLAVITANSTDVLLLFQDALGQFTSLQHLLVGSSVSAVIAADLDGDRDRDLVVLSRGAASLRILTNDGHGVFSVSNPIFSGGLSPSAVAAGDLDGDGDLDLAIANQGSNVVSVMLNRGDGAFGAAVNSVVGSAPIAIAAADVDRNGSLDLATLNQGDNSVSVLINKRDTSHDVPGQDIQLASVGDFVWQDINANGAQDPGESGVAGVVVELFSSMDDTVGNGDDASLDVAITDATGHYSFGQLSPGNYYLVFRLPVGYTFTAQDQGTDDTADSDAQASSGRTGLFTLTAGQDDPSRDAGLIGTGSGFGFALRLGDASAYNQGTSVTTDAAGNVYVAGSFLGTVDFDTGPGITNLTSATDRNLFVAKYTATGALLWARQQAGSDRSCPSDIAVDGGGNVYTTGYFWGTVDFDPGAATANLTSAGVADAFVSKLDSDGNYLWARQFGGGGGDSGAGIAVDGGGNVYTTGFFHGTADFAPGPGSANLTSAGASDVFVSKLDNNGNYVWARRIGGTNDEWSCGLALDRVGNVYTTGAFYDNTTDFDPGDGTVTFPWGGAFISKLDSAGNYVWARSIGSGPWDYGYGIAVDGDNNVYTTGNFNWSEDFDPGPGEAWLHGTSQEVFVSKLDSAGNYVWARNMGGEGQDYGYSIALDGRGDVYVTGYFAGTADFDPGAGTATLTSAGGQDVFVSKLDRDGNYLWARQLGGSGDDAGDDIAVAAAGNVYSAGYFTGMPDFDPGPGFFNLTSASSNLYLWKLDVGDIHGRVYHDRNEDDVQAQDGSEPGTVAWTIFADYNQNGVLDTDEPSALSCADDPATTDVDEAGTYTLSGVRPGTQRLLVILKSGWVPTTPVTGLEVTLPAGQVLKDVNYGLHYINEAPVLADTDVWALLPLTTNDSLNYGTPVSNLTRGIADGDAGAWKGIAITAADQSNGTVEYTLDGGTTWQTLGTVSAANALLLPDNANTRLRFRANGGFTGPVNSLVTFRAWDQTEGTVGQPYDTTVNGLNTAFSTATDTLTARLTSVFWDGDAGDGLWNTAANWNINTLPTSTDEVLIALAANPTVTLPAGTTTVTRLVNEGTLSVTATLKVTGPALVRGTLAMGSGAALTAEGSSASVTALGTITGQGTSFYALAGGKLYLPTLTTYVDVGSQVGCFRADGAGSRLEAPVLTGITGGTSNYAEVDIQAANGGYVNLPVVTQIQGPDGDGGAARGIKVSADGSGSTVNLAALTDFLDLDGNGASSIEQHHSGQVLMPKLARARGLSVRAYDGTNLSLPALESYVHGGSWTTHYLSAEGSGSQLNLPSLATITGGASNYADLFLQATAGGRVSLPALTSIEVPAGDGSANRGVTVSADGASSVVSLPCLTRFLGTSEYASSSLVVRNGGQLTAPNLGQASGLSLQVYDGTTLSLPALTTYAHGGAYTSRYFTAEGSGSVLNLPALTGITGGSQNSADLFIQAKSGGHVNLSGVTQMTLPAGGGQMGRSIQVLADGAGSQVDLSAMQQVLYQHNYQGSSQIKTTNQGAVTLSANTTSLADVDVIADTGTTITVGTLVLDAVSTISGTGTIHGHVQNAGQAKPGTAVGVLTIDGDYTQTATGSFNVELGGIIPGAGYDRLVVTGTATLDGTLSLSTINSFTPQLGQSFQVLSANAVSGRFTTVTGRNTGGNFGQEPVYGGTSMSLQTRFLVDTLTDSVDANPGNGVAADAGGKATLRAAIMEANSHSGDDVILLNAGTYTLSLTGAGEDAAATGDLDVAGNLTIVGAGSGSTLIDAGQIDRVFQVLPGVTLNLSGVTVRNGKVAADGGGILNAGTLVLTDSAVTNNQATAGAGGGIFSNGSLTATGTSVSSNSASGGGGGISGAGTWVISGSALANNSAGYGGGVAFSGSTAQISGSSLTQNTSTGNGGGIFVGGGAELTLSESTVSTNTAVSGAGLANAGSVHLVRSTLSGNTASMSGGGLWNDGGTVDVTGSTVSGNQVTGAGNTAGGIENRNNGTVTLVNATIANNLAASGGGIKNTAGTINLKNSLVAGNVVTVSAPDLSGAFTSQGHNLAGIGDGSTGVANGQNGDKAGTLLSPLDAKLGTLTNNGGPTKTHALLIGSPAIDAGDTTSTAAIDQRGVPRVLDGNADGTATADIGAVEYLDGYYVNSTADSVDANLGDGKALDSQGRTTLRAAIQQANATGGRQIIFVPGGTYALALAGIGEDAAATGDLDITSDVTLVGAGKTATIINANQLDRVFQVLNANLELTDLWITGGSVPNGGGGGLALAGGSTVLRRVELSDNVADIGSGNNGGGILATNGTFLRLEDTDVLRNHTDGGGGGLFATSTTLEVVNSRLEDNVAVGGHGGMFVANDVSGGQLGASVISGSRIANNRTAGNNGGVYYTGRPLTISDTTIVGNIAAGVAGGVSVAAEYGSGTITIERSLLADNQASEGAGLYVWYTDVILGNTTVSGNIATTNGGGVEVLGTDGGLTLTNSTITQNHAANGGGIWLASNRTLLVGDSVIAANTAATGVDLRADPNAVTSTGGNLIGNTNAANFIASTGDLLGTAGSPLDPKLGPLQDNGGATWTHAPLRGSPVIDAGTNTGAPATDQRGALRVTDGNGDGTATADIGAVEYGFLVNTTADTVDANPGDGLARDANGKTSLRAAVMEANASIGRDVIILPAGTYTLSLSSGADAAQGDLDVTDDLTIAGVGTGQTVINANQIDRVFELDAVKVRMSDLTITGGRAPDWTYGGGILSRADLTITNGAVIGNRTQTVMSGGGILSDRGTLTIRDSVVRDNQSGHAGGIESNFGTLMISGSNISNNTASRGDGQGGGVYNVGGVATIENSSLSDNWVADAGAAIANTAGGTLVVASCTIASNDTSVYGNGGGIFNGGASTVTISRSTLSANTARQGGAIVNGSDSIVYIESSTISGNEEKGYGGGGISNQGTLRITNSTISGNSATRGEFSWGGGIQNSGTLTITASTFSGNSTSKTGGALYNSSTKAVVITHSTFYGNAGNELGGIDQAGTGAFSIADTIVAGSTGTSSNYDVGGVFTSSGHNLIGNAGTATGFTNGINGDLVGTSGSPLDPKLGPLQDNGGLTLTRAPLMGSPAIDAGDDVGVTVTDQRGFPRSLGGTGDGLGRTDIGAVEYVDPSFFVVNSFADTVDAHPGDGVVADANGQRTLRAAIMEANALAGQQTIVLPAGTYNLTLAGAGEDATATGDLDISDDLTIIGAGRDQTTVDAKQLDGVFDVWGKYNVSSVHLEIDGLTVTGGLAESGAGLRLAPRNAWPNQKLIATVQNSRFIGNQATGVGGALLLSSDANLTLVGSEVAGNTALGGAAASWSHYTATLTLVDSSVHGNVSSDNGVIRSYGTLNITGSAIYDNVAVAHGAIEILDGAVQLTNSTISGNRSRDVGGMYVAQEFHPVLVNNCTVTGNTATESGVGGILNFGGTDLTNSVVAGNFAVAGDPDVGGERMFRSHGHNLIGNLNWAANFPQGVAGDLFGYHNNALDPKLGPLQDNGGPTWTHAPLRGSPLIDAGDSTAAPATDQRGAPRGLTGAATVDIGAVEYGFLVNTTADTVDAHPGDGEARDTNGKTSLRAAIMEANASAGRDVIILPAGSYALSIAGTNEDAAATGDLDITDTTGSLTIVGAGAAQTIIDARGIDRVFHIPGQAALNLVGVTVTGGSLPDHNGAGIYNYGTLSVTDSTISGNTNLRGGGLWNGPASSTVLLRTTFSGNTATDYGGAIYQYGGTLLITNSTFTGNQNTGLHGGAIWALNGAITTIVDSAIVGNTTRSAGGGIGLNSDAGQTTITGSTISNNSASEGSGIFSSAVLTISNSSVTGNSASGAITTTNGGGGIKSTGTLTISATTVANNTSSGLNSQGGGIWNMGVLTSTNSTISGNSTASDGGGIYNASANSVTLTNTTLYGNTASGAGGGLRQAGSGSLEVKNTIVAGNTGTAGGLDVSGAFTSRGHNLIGNVGTATGFANGTNGDLVGTSGSPLDAKLGPLQNNGGPTQTRTPLAGSQAIDAGDDAGVAAVDQRGAPRQLDGNSDGTSHVDIGAVEYVNGFFVDSFLDTIDANPGDGLAADANGRHTLRAAIMEANARAGADTIVLAAGAYTLTLAGRGGKRCRHGRFGY